VNDPLVPGDYVLATKYDDGDPCDHFCVGFFRGMLCGDRYMVEDDKGQLFRANGFRRCERIDDRTGAVICRAVPIIGDKRGKSLWWWASHIDELERYCRVYQGECRGDDDI